MTETPSTENGQTLTGLLDEQLNETRGQETVTLGELLDASGRSSYGPLLLVPSLIALSPLGVIPGMAVVTGSIIILIAAQILAGLHHPWLPRWALNYSFSRERLQSFAENFRGWTRWIDGFLSARLTRLTEPPFVQLLALVFIVLALTFYPLALVPFGVAAPSGAASILALGLTARDGVVVLFGTALTGVTAWLLFAFWPF